VVPRFMRVNNRPDRHNGRRLYASRPTWCSRWTRHREVCNGARWESQPRMSNTKRPIDSQDDTDISIGTISRQEGWEIEVETTNE